MVERRYLKVGLALVVATTALIIGLSVGIARGSGRSSSPSNASALSAYDCEGDGASSSYYYAGGKSGKSGTPGKSGKGVKGGKSSSGKSGKSVSSYDVTAESGASREEMSYGGGGERGSASMSFEFGRGLLGGEGSSSSASPGRRRSATTRRGLVSEMRGEG
jgi:hypothetical protein